MGTMQYEKMKDSSVEWIGEMPSHWTMLRNKNVFFERKELVGERSSGYTLLSLTLSGIIPRDMTSGKGKFPADFNTYKVVKNGDMVFCLFDMDETPRTVGLSQYDGMITGAYDVFAIRNANPSFLLYYYLSVDNHKALRPYYTGLRKVVNPPRFMRLKLPFPPLSEQTAIAAYLDEKCATIDAIVTEAKATIEEYKAWKASVIFEAVTKGLDPNAEMKDSGVEWIGQIPKGWDVRKIKSVCRLKTGCTPNTSHPEWFNGNVMWYTPGDFSEHYMLGVSLRNLSEQAIYDNVAVRIPQDSVLLVGIGATAGKVGYASLECSINQQITALIPFNMSSKYLMYCLISSAKTLRELANYTTLPIINNSTLGNFAATVPPLSEQAAIAAYLDDKCSAIDSIIAEKEALIADMEAYKKSLIFETVTGKRRVC